MRGAAAPPRADIGFRWGGRVFRGRIPTPAEYERFLPRFALLDQGALHEQEIHRLYREFIDLLFPAPPIRPPRWWDRVWPRQPARAARAARAASSVFLLELPDVVQTAALRHFRAEFARLARPTRARVRGPAVAASPAVRR